MDAYCGTGLLTQLLAQSIHRSILGQRRYCCRTSPRKKIFSKSIESRFNLDTRIKSKFIIFTLLEKS